MSFLLAVPVALALLAAPAPQVECAPEEVAYYESQGWDSWECHWDKQAEQEEGK